MKEKSIIIFIINNRLYLMGVATIIILFFHIFQCYESNELGSAPFFFRYMRNWGAIGVDWFLFLSAYGLKNSYDRNTMIKFYRNRIMRILPSYIPFLIILYTIFLSGATIGTIIKETIFQITGFSLIKYADFFYAGFCFDWYTPAIMFLYISFPILSYVAEKINTWPLLAQVASILSVSIIGIWITENKHFPMWLLSYRFSLFLLGILLYIKVRDGKEKEHIIICAAYLIIGIFSDTKLFLVSSITPSLFILLSIANLIMPLKKGISYIGKYSYEIYIAQIIPVQFIYRMNISNDLFLLSTISIVTTGFFGALFAFCNHLLYKRKH